MGLLHADIAFANARQDDLSPMVVNALVDSGALHLCLPQQIAARLRLPVLDRRVVKLADGVPREVDYAEPIRVRFASRQCPAGALVLCDEAVLGAIPMEDTNFVISPPRRSPIVNPASPNIAVSMAKGMAIKVPPLDVAA